MRVLGSTVPSPDVTWVPATTRSVRVEPSALLTAPSAVRVLATLAITPAAVITPLRMLTFPTEATLCAAAAEGSPNLSTEPDVMLFRKSTDSALPADNPSDSAFAMSPPSGPETAGRTASGAWTVEPSGVLAYTPYARPLTDWATPAVASPAVRPTIRPRAARRLAHCVCMRFIAQPPRCSVRLDVAARQELQLRVAEVLHALPPERIGSEARTRARLAVVAGAHARLLRELYAAESDGVPARRGRSDDHAKAPTRAEIRVRRHRGATIGAVHAIVDGHVPGDLERILRLMVDDLDLALLHDAVAVGIRAEEDVEPEGDLAA